MDIFEMAGFSKEVSRALNKALYRSFISRKTRNRRIAAKLNNEIIKMIDPSADFDDMDLVPTLCGFGLSHLRGEFDLDHERIKELPVTVSPWILRVLKGAAFLKKYMDIGRITCSDEQALLELFKLDKISKGSEYEYNESACISEEDIAEFMEKVGIRGGEQE